MDSGTIRWDRWASTPILEESAQEHDGGEKMIIKKARTEEQKWIPLRKGREKGSYFILGSQKTRETRLETHERNIKPL